MNNYNILLLVFPILVLGCITNNRTCQKSESSIEIQEQVTFWELSHQNKWDKEVPKILEFTREYITNLPASINCFQYKFDPAPPLRDDSIAYIGIELYDKRKVIKTRGIDGKIYISYNQIETLYFDPETYKYEFTNTVADTKKEQKQFERRLKKYFKKEKTAHNNGEHP